MIAGLQQAGVSVGEKLGDALRAVLGVCLLSAIIDLWLLPELDTSALVIVAGSWSAFALLMSPAVALAAALLGFKPGAKEAPRPSAIGFLVVLSILGSLLVLANRETFLGAGLRARGLSSLFEGLAIAGGLSLAVLLAQRLRVALWRRRQGQPDRSRWVALFLALAFALADRLLYRGQYPALHAQLLIAMPLLAAAFVYGQRRERRPWRPRFDGVVAALLFTLALLLALLVHRPSSGPALSRITQLQAGASRGLLSLLAPLLPEGSDGFDADNFDVDSILERGVSGRSASSKLMASRIESGQRPHLILVSLDTLRADRCGFLGHERPTTPHWDALAADSAVFERAYTPYPTSNYAYSSLFSSRWPQECPQRLVDRGPARVSQLAERLSAEGYRSEAITAFAPKQIAAGAPFSTFPRGFMRFDALRGPDREADGQEDIVPAARERLRDLAGTENPFFLWVHLFDPHNPYYARAGLDFGDKSIDRYDAEIAYADRALGALWNEVKALELDRRCIIVVHSDHGESFGEHGTDYHGSSLYEEQLRVPLTIRLPGAGAGGARLRETVSLVDLMPTLLTLCGCEDPEATRRRGRDLAPLLLGEREEEPDGGFAFAQLLIEWFHNQKRHALIRGGKKLIQAPRGFPRWEFYRHDEDPGEVENRFGEGDPDEGPLRALLERIRGEIEDDS